MAADTVVNANTTAMTTTNATVVAESATMITIHITYRSSTRDSIPWLIQSSSYCTWLHNMWQQMCWEACPLQNIRVPLCHRRVKVTPPCCILNRHDGTIQVTEHCHSKVLHRSSSVVMFQFVRSEECIK